MASAQYGRDPCDAERTRQGPHAASPRGGEISGIGGDGRSSRLPVRQIVAVKDGVGPPWDGIELDDETLKSRKMVDEVSTMIKDNPENAASLVKRWLTKGK